MKYGEVWLVDFEPQVGHEARKTRPAIILSNDSIGKLPLKIVVPVTAGQKNQQEWQVILRPGLVNGLIKISFADCFQVKSIDQKRFVKKIGVLNEDEITDIQIALMKVLNLL